MYSSQYGFSDYPRRQPNQVSQDSRGTADFALHRLIMRRSLAYLLRSIIFSFGRLKGFNHLDFLIGLAIWNANSRQQVADVRAAYRRCFAVYAADPLGKQSGISRSAVSRLLNIPLETVRRRVAALVRNGIVTENVDGLICAGFVDAYDGNFAVVERNNADALACMYNRIVEDGIALPPAPWIATADGKRLDRAAEEWVAAVTLYSIEYQVLMLSEMLSVFKIRFVQMFILLTVFMHNVEHLLSGTASRAVPYILPDPLRHGAARKAIEQYLALPNETVRRQIFGLLSKGFLVEREDGLIVPGRVAAQCFDETLLSAHNTRYLTATLSRLHALADYQTTQAAPRPVL
jgi:predicted DNA-binding transcriptional regulator